MAPAIRRATTADAAALAAIGAETFTLTFGHLYRPEDLGSLADDGPRDAVVVGHDHRRVADLLGEQVVHGPP